MELSKSLPADQETAIGGLFKIGRDYVEELSHGVDRFLAWERENILLKDPSPKEQVEHRRILKFFLMVMRLVQAAAEPDYPDPVVRDILKAQIWRLEQSWKQFFEPMPDEEADKLLAEVFPKGPRA